MGGELESHPDSPHAQDFSDLGYGFDFPSRASVDASAAAAEGLGSPDAQLQAAHEDGPVSPSPCFVPGLPHVLRILELREACISYRDYRMMLLTSRRPSLESQTVVSSVASSAMTLVGEAQGEAALLAEAPREQGEGEASAVQRGSRSRSPSP